MNTQIYEEASDWLVKNREGELDPRQKRRFDAWLRESPQHVRAYLEMSALWEDVATLDRRNADGHELLLRAQSEHNILSLKVPDATETGLSEAPAHLQPSRAEAPSTFHLFAINLRAFASAALLVACISAGTWYWLNRDIYGTDIGEQRSIVLNDGSTIELNSRSRVRIRYTDTQRDIDLLEGQAIFRVARNATRPFVVHTQSAKVRAVGTQFDVYLKRDRTVVTVLEGRVAVAPSPAVPVIPESNEPRAGAPTSPRRVSGKGPGGEVSLVAGEQLTVPALGVSGTDTAIPAPEPADIAAAAAWTERSLVFHASPLAEVAEEFNRYNTRQLVVSDAELGSIRISGVFSSVDASLLLRFLHTQPELHIEETDREIRITRR